MKLSRHFTIKDNHLQRIGQGCVALMRREEITAGITAAMERLPWQK